MPESQRNSGGTDLVPLGPVPAQSTAKLVGWWACSRLVWLHFMGLQGWPNHVQCCPSLQLAPCPNCAHFKAAVLQPAGITEDAQMPCAGGAPTLALSTALSLSLVLGITGPEHRAHLACMRVAVVPWSSVTSSPSAVAVQMELWGPQHGGSCH